MDPIANSFVQLKNGQASLKKEVILTYSKMKLAILEVLKKQELIEKAEVINEEGKKYPTGILVTLKYKNHERVLANIKRVSKPGRRVYVAANKIRSVQKGRATVILSTSQGVMSGADAIKKCLGGEIICEVVNE